MDVSMDIYVKTGCGYGREILHPRQAW